LRIAAKIRIRRFATQIRAIVDATHIRLNSASGMEAGTILQPHQCRGDLVDTPFKVISIDRQADNLITLDGGVASSRRCGPWQLRALAGISAQCAAVAPARRCRSRPQRNGGWIRNPIDISRWIGGIAATSKK